MASKTLKDVLREQAMLQARTRARDGRGRVARGADDPAAALPVIHIRDAKRLDFALLEQNRAVAEVAAADASPEQAFLETPPSQAHMRGHHARAQEQANRTSPRRQALLSTPRCKN
ncbi:hypothetical protein A0H81_14657 [Grifola frondosa]|uniref:Uncharacterized protein n=1 Tax=Grifola frondosa TaxID=5627 RepID=A0A1C7LN07_GRIFR|nr:hypothetical protein A0H81_14657 [Grifola frondosa]